MLALAAHSLSDMRLYEKELYLSMLQTEHPANNREQIARNRTLTSAVSFWGDIAEKPSSYLEDNGEIAEYDRICSLKNSRLEGRS